MNRRGFIKTAGGILALLLAGCGKPGCLHSVGDIVVSRISGEPAEVIKVVGPIDYYGNRKNCLIAVEYLSGGVSEELEPDWRFDKFQSSSARDCHTENGPPSHRLDCPIPGTSS